MQVKYLCRLESFGIIIVFTMTKYGKKSKGGRHMITKV